MWQNNFQRILKLTENGVALNDEESNKLIFVQDLNSIIQFEIDNPFQNFRPNFHYTVEPKESAVTQQLNELI
jgi:hypothetical protein